jgi:hypothetical protein
VVAFAVTGRQTSRDVPAGGLAQQERAEIHAPLTARGQR